eukprot:1360738-Amorphochlora_amoeboformis.AAC.1
MWGAWREFSPRDSRGEECCKEDNVRPRSSDHMHSNAGKRGKGRKDEVCKSLGNRFKEYKFYIGAAR